jgi:protein ImuA
VQPIPQTNSQCAGVTVPATTLAEVLARPDIWRGDALASAPKPGVSTGFPALDAELPGGGWPRGAVVELMLRQSRIGGVSGVGGIGELTLLMPALTGQFSSGNTGWTICIAPPLLPFASGWTSNAHALALQRLMIIRARGEDAAWACARALDTEGVGAVLAWLPNSRTATIRRLQLLAERSEALVFVFRPYACATQSSSAPLRLMLDGEPLNGVATPRSGVKGMQSLPAPTGKTASETTSATLAVHLLKRRGAGRTAPLYLNVPRPRRQSYTVPNFLADTLPVARRPVALPSVDSHVVAEPVISAISA